MPRRKVRLPPPLGNEEFQDNIWDIMSTSTAIADDVEERRLGDYAGRHVRTKRRPRSALPPEPDLDLVCSFPPVGRSRPALDQGRCRSVCPTMGVEHAASTSALGVVTTVSESVTDVLDMPSDWSHLSVAPMTATVGADGPPSPLDLLAAVAAAADKAHIPGDSWSPYSGGITCQEIGGGTVPGAGAVVSRSGNSPRDTACSRGPFALYGSAVQEQHQPVVAVTRSPDPADVPTPPMFTTESPTVDDGWEELPPLVDSTFSDLHLSREISRLRFESDVVGNGPCVAVEDFDIVLEASLVENGLLKAGLSRSRAADSFSRPRKSSYRGGKRRKRKSTAKSPSGAKKRRTEPPAVVAGPSHASSTAGKCDSTGASSGQSVCCVCPGEHEPAAHFHVVCRQSPDAAGLARMVQRFGRVSRVGVTPGGVGHVHLRELQALCALLQSELAVQLRARFCLKCRNVLKSLGGFFVVPFFVLFLAGKVLSCLRGT